MLVSKSVANKLKTNTLYNTIRLHSPDNSFDDITGENIVLDSFSLEQEITDKELKFGGCIASEMSVKLINYNCSKLIGKKVQVILTATYLESEMYPSDSLYPLKKLVLPAETGTVECPIFYGKVRFSERDKKNRNITEITAYDAFYDMSKTDISMWFAGKYTEGGNFSYGFAHFAKDKTFKYLFSAMHEKLANYGVLPKYSPRINIESLPLNFDDDCVEKVIKDFTLIDLVQAYSELTLSFSVIEPQVGNLEFLSLYGSKSADTIESYKELSFEDYELEPIGMYSTKYANKKVYLYGGSNDCSWYISDNILMRCRTNAYDIISKYNNNNFFGNVYRYRPTKVSLFSYWWLEVGDKYTVQTPFEDLPTIESFVFNKKMSGFITTLSANGEKRLGKEVKDIE